MKKTKIVLNEKNDIKVTKIEVLQSKTFEKFRNRRFMLPQLSVSGSEKLKRKNNDK